jgi:hypothetical protein
MTESYTIPVTENTYFTMVDTILQGLTDFNKNYSDPSIQNYIFFLKKATRIINSMVIVPDDLPQLDPSLPIDVSCTTLKSDD